MKAERNKEASRGLWLLNWLARKKWKECEWPRGWLNRLNDGLWKAFESQEEGSEHVSVDSKKQ